MAEKSNNSAEAVRLEQDAKREMNWKRWGPYLSERQWGTVREDYSADGNAWAYFPHDHARSRAYRWGEDGLLGICDRECRLCFAVALWNGKDPILKERLFGLTGPEGNHGEDVKEEYFYLDSSPTHSYMRALYKYPQQEFPYDELAAINNRRDRHEREYELSDTGIFNENRYYDVFAEYAKRSPNDTLIKLTIHNRGPDEETLHLLPTLWFRNAWSWGCEHEGCSLKPMLKATGPHTVEAEHDELGRFIWEIESTRQVSPTLMFTDNETNEIRLFKAPANHGFVKDAFHRYVIDGETAAINPKKIGTKVAAHFKLKIPAGASQTIRLRLFAESEKPDAVFNDAFEEIFAARKKECDTFYSRRIPEHLSAEHHRIARQAYAGLLWSKQFYHYVVKSWVDGDPYQPPPPPQRHDGRNHDWEHLFSKDVLSMPDKWEYPWFAAWDLAFHMLPFSRIDPQLAKDQLLLLLREWYMHPNGQIPAYEWSFADVNPPVHAWACWRVYKMTGQRGKRDKLFLARAFQKLMLNFTWWVNRKDDFGKHIFGGGFLGLDNIGLFDRSQPLPTGGHLEQADGTAWMAFYCATMLAMALELARDDKSYEDIASKFFEHFVAIIDAMNSLGGSGLWDHEDGFYYDQIYLNKVAMPLRVRSMVGIIPMFACEILEQDLVDSLPGFRKRLHWFWKNQKDLARHLTMQTIDEGNGPHMALLISVPPRERLERMLKYILDESEFLSPFGVRSLSKVYEKAPYVFHANGEEFRCEYEPGEGRTELFGGNSNWRGPIWFPVNHLLIEALERYHHFYGDSFKVECPTGSGVLMNLKEVAHELSRRMLRLFEPDAEGKRPAHGDEARYATDPNFKDLVLFYEHFHGDTGRGLGASHQTGWTSLIVHCLEKIAQDKR
jgi:hypothetical protein